MDTAPSDTVSPRKAGREPDTTILIVEDSPVQAELLRRAIEEAGYRVIAARDGAEGLALAKAHKPAVVVSDINMPVMDGYALCHAIRGDTELKFTPVILLTMLSDPVDVVRGVNAGADAYLTKPYNIPSLISRIELLLAYPPAPPPPVERRKVEVRLEGEAYLVDAHGPRILNLLISTYENAVLQNRELTATQQALEDLNEHLEQKVLEQTAALRTSEARFRSLAEMSSDFYWETDTEHRLKAREAAIAKRSSVTGFDQGTQIGKRRWEIPHLSPDEAGWQVHRALLDAHLPFRNFEISRLGIDGGERHLSISGDPVFDAAGAFEGYRGVGTDITERKRSVQALKLFRTLIDHADDAIEVLDAETLRYLDFNDAACRSLGYSRDELLAMTAYDIDPGLERSTAARVTEQLRELRPLTFETVHRRKDGSTFPAEVSIQRVELDRAYHLVSARDITQRKLAEAALARVNRALRTLSAGNTALVHASNEQLLIEKMCRIIVETGGYRAAWVGYAEHDERKTVRPVAHCIQGNAYVEREIVSWADNAAGQGPSGIAIRTAKPHVVHDAIADPRYAPWRDHAIRLGYAAVACFPLLDADNLVLGVLCIFSAESGGFTQEESDLLAELAGDLAFGINSIRARIAHEQSIVLLNRSMEGTIQAMAATLETRDAYTAGHQRRVAELVLAIAGELHLAEDDIHAAHLAAIVHDLGKIQVPAEILSKPGKLLPVEFDLIKYHPTSGYNILKDVDFPWPIAEIVYQHHERLDGSGYPRGLKGDEILPAAKIIAVADTVEAMSSHRPYRAGLGIDMALAEIERGRGSVYDAAAVDTCVKLFREKRFAFSV